MANDYADKINQIARRLKQIADKAKAGKKLSEEEQAFLEQKTARNPNKLDQRRWTIEIAAAEFDINPRTLSKRIKTQGIEPGKDGKFSTLQITAAVFGDLWGENLRKVRTEADILERKRGEMDRRLLPADAVQQMWRFVLANLRSKIWNSRLPEKLRRDTLLELQDIPVEQYTNSKPVELEEDE